MGAKFALGVNGCGTPANCTYPECGCAHAYVGVVAATPQDTVGTFQGLTAEQLAALVKLVEGRTGYKLAYMTPEEILRLNP